MTTPERRAEEIQELWAAFVSQGWRTNVSFVGSQIPKQDPRAPYVTLTPEWAERFSAHFAMLLGALSVYTGLAPSELTPDSVREHVFKLAYGRQPGREEP